MTRELFQPGIIGGIPVESATKLTFLTETNDHQPVLPIRQAGGRRPEDSMYP